MSDRNATPRHSSAERRGLVVLAVVLLVSFSLKLAVWAALLPHPERFEERDSLRYSTSARALLEERVFAPSPELAGVAETKRTPGYPVFLAGSYALFGESYAPVILLQILLSLGTMGLAFRLARTLWGVRVAALAVLLLLLDVPSFTSSLRVMSDSLFVLLTTGMLFAGVTVLQRPRKAVPALAVGVLLTLATFVRPVSYYLVVPLLAGVLFLAVTRRWSLKKSAIALTAILVPYVLGIGAWQLRNHELTGSPGFSSLEGFSLLYYRGAPIVALRDGISLSEARVELGLELGHLEYSLANDWRPAQDAAWKREATELIVSHPILFLRSQLPGALRLALSPGDGDLMRMLGMAVPDPTVATEYLERFSSLGSALVSGWAVLYLFVLYAGILAWAWARASDRSLGSVDLFLWVVVLYFTVVSAGQGDSRIRLPMMPILVMYSAQGLLYLWQRLRAGGEARAEGS